MPVCDTHTCPNPTRTHASMRRALMPVSKAHSCPFPMCICMANPKLLPRACLLLILEQQCAVLCSFPPGPIRPAQPPAWYDALGCAPSVRGLCVAGPAPLLVVLTRLVSWLCCSWPGPANSLPGRPPLYRAKRISTVPQCTSTMPVPQCSSHGLLSHSAPALSAVP